MRPQAHSGAGPSDGAASLQVPSDEPAGQGPDQAGAPAGQYVARVVDQTDRGLALDQAIEELDLLGTVRRGDSVYIRVNSNSGDPYPYSTSPDVLIDVGKRLRDLGVTDLRIGDRSFWGDPNTAANLDRNGLAAASRTLGTEALVFDDSIDWVDLPAETLPNWRPPVRIPRLVQTATHFINLACVKTHFIANITMCLKLCLGLVHARDREREGNLRTHVRSRLWTQIAEVNAHVRPRINILDGYEAVITGGPTIQDRPSSAPANWQPATARLRTIIASADPIAADLAGAALLRTVSPAFEAVRRSLPAELPQIRAARQFGGIGVSDPSEVRLIGPGMPQLESLQAQLSDRRDGGA